MVIAIPTNLAVVCVDEQHYMGEDIIILLDNATGNITLKYVTIAARHTIL